MSLQLPRASVYDSLRSPSRLVIRVGGLAAVVRQPTSMNR